MVFLESSTSRLRRLLSVFAKYFSCNHFYQTPSVQTILVSVNRFNFLTLVLSSSILSMAMYLPRTHLCHMIFHSLYYHFVIWGHLLIASIRLPRLIKSLTIWLLSDALLLILLNFEIYCSETILWPIPLPFDVLSLSMHLLVHFEACHLFMWLGFEP
jgi:hypothetical protein